MTLLQALDNIIETFIDKDSEDIKTVRKALEALEVLKECFDFEGFDEFIPNGKWFEKDFEQRNEILKELIK